MGIESFPKAADFDEDGGVEQKPKKARKRGKSLRQERLGEESEALSPERAPLDRALEQTVDDLRSSFLEVSAEPVMEEEGSVATGIDDVVAEEKMEKVNEAFLSHFSVQPETERTPSKFTQRHIDEHRTRIAADETLSEKTKKELSNLVDELQEIKKGLNMKSFSPKEAADKRRRANDILERLTTGAEKGITKERINEIVAERTSIAEDKEAAVSEPFSVPEATTLPHEAVTEGETSKIESGVQPSASEKTPKEIIDEWLMSGKVIKVERTGGGVEDGWRIARLYENGAAVLSPDQSVLKKVPFEKLIAWQGLEVTSKEELARAEEAPRSAEPTPQEPEKAQVASVAEEIQSPENAAEIVAVQNELAALPEKTRMETVRGWAGVAFTAQEMKNRGLARALHFASGLFGSEENKRKADSEKSGVRLLLDAYARQYDDLARTSATQREVFVKSGKGVGGFATNAILTTRAGLSLFGLANPIGNIATWGTLFARRGIEAVKETRFAKRSETFRVQDEELAFEEAKRLETLASIESQKGTEKLTADDIARVYLRELPDLVLKRLTGESHRYAAAFGVRKIVEKIQREVANADKLPEAARQAKKDAILKKHGKTLRDLDRIVGNGATIDSVSLNLVHAGIWSNRIATVLAIESLAEGAHAIIERLGDHGDVAEAVTETVPKGGVSVVPAQEMAESLGETEGLDLSNVEAPEDLPEPAVIGHGGNIWSSAKDIAEKAGLSKEQFASAWTESTVALPDGRVIPLAELNLVHEGDTLSYVPGEEGEAGHFEFNNGSEIPFGDATNLPGAEDAGHISHEDFEQKPWKEEPIHTDTFEQAPWEEETADGTSLQDVVTPEMLTDTAGGESPAETTEYFEPQPVSEGWTLQERVAYEFNRDMRNLFGDVDPERSEWQQWKGVSAKKFMEYRLEEQTPAHSLLIYLKVLMRQSHLRPIGGLFRREEKIGDFVERALSVIASEER